MKIDRMAAGLNDKNIRAADVFENLETRFAVAELTAFGAAARHAQVMADGLAKCGVSTAAENLELVVSQHEPLGRFSVEPFERTCQTIARWSIALR